MADATTTHEPSEELGGTANDVKVEDAGPALKRLTITIPAESVTEKVEESLGTLAHEATLPGFRRGKAPRRLLEKRFGTTVREETRNRLIADAYAQAIQDAGIKPVGDPEPTQSTEDLVVEPGKPLEFSVEVEVAPEFELPALDEIEIKKPLLEITDEHVTDRIERQQLRLGQSERIEGDFREGDRLGGQVTLTKEGEEKPLLENEEAIILVPGKEDGGRGPVLGFMIDGLAKTVEGSRVGDTLTIETVGPAGHEREDVRDARLTITFRVVAAERPRPATVEQLVEVFGVGSEENLREQMRMALEHQRDQEQANAMREQVYTYLLDSVEMELPERLSAMQAARTLEGLRLQLLEKGLTAEEVEAQLAEMRGHSMDEARNRLKLFFLLRRLGEHFNINVSEQEVNGRIATIAAQHGQRPDQLRAELARTGRINEVARVVYEQKAADRVLATARVEEIPAADWNEVMQKSAGKPAGGAKSATRKKTSRKTSKKTSKKTAGKE